jgi:penicillin-binding protein 1B
VARIEVEKGRIATLRRGDGTAPQLVLEPPLLASYRGEERRECWPVRRDELPDHVLHAVLAAEDAAFFVHPGVSLLGVGRALLANLRAGEIVQGGSTITQQLVKNLVLGPERTLSRKAREAVLALLLEMRYGKARILEMYLNEVYLGSRGGANLAGIGAAARAYFGKDARDLTLAEAATLAGMIQAPAAYLPHRDPERARERRDWVLSRMKELDWVELAAPVRTVERPPEYPNAASHLAAAVAAEADDRFDVEQLADQGYLLLTAIEPAAQRAAQAAVERSLAELEKRPRLRAQPVRPRARRAPSGREPVQAGGVRGGLQLRRGAARLRARRLADHRASGSRRVAAAQRRRHLPRRGHRASRHGAVAQHPGGAPRGGQRRRAGRRAGARDGRALAARGAAVDGARRLRGDAARDGGGLRDARRGRAAS